MVYPSTGTNDLRADVFIGPFLPFEQGGGNVCGDNVHTRHRPSQTPF